MLPLPFREAILPLMKGKNDQRWPPYPKVVYQKVGPMSSGPGMVTNTWLEHMEVAKHDLFEHVPCGLD